MTNQKALPVRAGPSIVACGSHGPYPEVASLMIIRSAAHGKAGPGRSRKRLSPDGFIVAIKVIMAGIVASRRSGGKEPGGC